MSNLQADSEGTRAGNQFISNYPPYSLWSATELPKLQAVLAASAPADVALGLYVHLPFCRKRCDFCFYKVYTDKNARQIEHYLAALARELELYRECERIRGRRLDFVYFGGGTPSYLSTAQLEALFGSLQSRFPWQGVREVTFECEPGTLQPHKLERLARLGVTRLSLGVEHFDEEILALNNRAHRAKEIYSAFAAARSVGFPQINIDLIAGMVGESEENWRRAVAETIRLAPDSVTIYQMEVPHNTTIYRRMQEGHSEVAPVADWPTKRRWVDYAFRELEQAGFHVSSGYTLVRGDGQGFQYRDALWHGADLLGLGVSSFGHLGGVHYQNEHAFEQYVERVQRGELPILRALAPTAEERMIREFVLQMKTGRIESRYFREKFGIDPLQRFAEPLERQRAAGYLLTSAEGVRATRSGLLRIDSLLRDYFLPEHREVRYV